MTTLTSYIKKYPRNDRRYVIAEIANYLNVSKSAVVHWCNGQRKIRPLLALRLEEITKGEVSRHELRPDIYPPPPKESLGDED